MSLFDKFLKTPKKNAPTEPLILSIVGMDYYPQNLEKIGEPLKGYNMSLEAMQRSKKNRFYKYFFNIQNIELVYETNNKVDPNAVMIMVNGVKVGYVLSMYASLVKEYLKHPCTIEGNIQGGPFRQLKNGVVTDGNQPYSGEIKITPRN